MMRRTTNYCVPLSRVVGADDGCAGTGYHSSRRGESSLGLFFSVPPMTSLFGWLLGYAQKPTLAWVGLALSATGVAPASRGAWMVHVGPHVR